MKTDENFDYINEMIDESIIEDIKNNNKLSEDKKKKLKEEQDAKKH